MFGSKKGASAGLDGKPEPAANLQHSIKEKTEQLIYQLKKLDAKQIVERLSVASDEAVKFRSEVRAFIASNAGGPLRETLLGSLLLDQLRSGNHAEFLLVFQYFYSDEENKINCALVHVDVVASALIFLDDNEFCHFLQLFSRPSDLINYFCKSEDRRLVFVGEQYLSVKKLNALCDCSPDTTSLMNILSIAFSAPSDVFLRFVEIAKIREIPTKWPEAGIYFFQLVYTQIHGAIGNLSPKALGIFLNLMTGDAKLFAIFLQENPLVQKILFSYMLYEPSWKDLPPNSHFVDVADNKAQPDVRRNENLSRLHLVEKLFHLQAKNF